MSSYPSSPVRFGALQEQKRDVAVRVVDEHRLSVDSIEQGGVLPVAHVALGEPEVERGEQLAQPVLGRRVGYVGPGYDVLGVETKVVGQELQRLHLLGANAAGAVRDVAHGLVTPLVREFPAREP